jgi:hypothetical protein
LCCWPSPDLPARFPTTTGGSRRRCCSVVNPGFSRIAGPTSASSPPSTMKPCTRFRKRPTSTTWWFCFPHEPSGSTCPGPTRTSTRFIFWNGTDRKVVIRGCASPTRAVSTRGTRRRVASGVTRSSGTGGGTTRFGRPDAN